MSIKVQTAAVALAMLTLGTLAALAQKATLTCSDSFRQCTTEAVQPRICLLAKQECMKSGRWIGPATGKDFGTRLKK